jgi:excisionase family DNA binding protein
MKSEVTEPSLPEVEWRGDAPRPGQAVGPQDRPLLGDGPRQVVSPVPRSASRSISSDAERTARGVGRAGPRSESWPVSGARVARGRSALAGRVREVNAAPKALPELPTLVTVDEVAAWLRTSRKAIYAKAERGTIPGATRVGARLYFLRAELLRWVEQGLVPDMEK